MHGARRPLKASFIKLYQDERRGLDTLIHGDRWCHGGIESQTVAASANPTSGRTLVKLTKRISSTVEELCFGRCCLLTASLR